MKERVFSGIQPTGNIHIGNYLAAVRRWVELQNEYENLFCIVDLHAITVPQDPSMLKAKIRETAGLLFAAGIDPEKSSVFVQSHLSAHAELAWILNCIIPLGWMQRMTQFKEKSAMQRRTVSTGLFDYPALMAADILLYQADLVPVGEDQRQHIELTRDAARRFNAIYGETFRIPEAVIPEVGARIMDLADPLKKMSKSGPGGAMAIGLLDTPEAVRSKIMKAQTDSLRDIRFDEGRPGIHNLLVIYELFTGMARTAIERRFSAKGYADLKRELAEIIIGNLSPLQSHYRELTSDPSYINHLLTEGAQRVRPLAERTLSLVKERMGLG